MIKNEIAQTALANPFLRWTRPTVSIAAPSLPPNLFPSDLQSWLDANSLIYLILEIQDSIPWTAALLPIEQPDGSRIKPRILLVLLTYAYCRGFYSTQEIINECQEDAMLEYLCARQLPEVDVLRSFRRHHRELLRFNLARTLAVAAREPSRTRPRGFLDHMGPAFAAYCEAEADARLRLAIQLDTIERDF
jgi:hypothetical protein